MLEIVLGLALTAAAAMSWQHLRYVRIRRKSAQDRQNLWHANEAFHVLVFFTLRKGDKLIDTVNRFLQLMQNNSKSQLIYAGQAAFTVNSKQLGNYAWDGVLVYEYPSRSDYQSIFVRGQIDQARQCFAESYLHGMRRNRQKNIAIPQFLLRRRIKDILSGLWRVEPLEPSPMFATFPEYETWRGREARLRACNQINGNGMVVYSLVKRGNRTQQPDDTLFDKQMGSRMAALSHGPVHMGRSVALENLARFDQVFGIHYPSAGYFADLLASQYGKNIIGSTQFSDYLAVFTVPITDRL